MKLATSRFGIIDIEEEQVIFMPSGMVGFPEEKRFVLLGHEEGSPFFWFQSVDNDSLAFVLTDPLLFRPDYEIDVSPEDTEALELNRTSEGIRTLVVVNIRISNGVSQISANLLGPIVINALRRLAKQVVLYGSPYSHCHPISISAAQRQK